MRIPLFLLALIGICVGIWIGFPMIGWDPIAGPWVRGSLIAAIWITLAFVYGNRWRRRRRAAKELEEELMPAPVGDGKILSERMTEALAVLKRSGGKNYLYDLPWYVIIGPPAAGKTTALTNAGIEFPGQEMMPDKAQGFGGTRNCDWWFAEEAVLIDTAGRYTMHDSDVEADKASWTAFLELLKRGRSDQPINGVILAFSIEDMMRGTPESLAQHAATVRLRLSEIHETLRIDFPVYVLFTKADLIAGFREYFASFSQSRRKLVWGVTFQTRDRKEQTYKNVGTEFDALVSRLSDEVIDRMNEEPDGASRIAIFGLPGQMAMLRENIEDFLRRIFEPTRYKTNAILRGFYFTSGTQEGTPLDQVLGEMSRNTTSDGYAFQPAFMSGQGKSYFLHDLLKKVIFEEQDWVSFDLKSVRRRAILRTAAISTVALVTLGSMVAFGYSFWQNASFVKEVDAVAAAYSDTARNELNRTIISDPDPSPVIPYLDDLRRFPGGVGNQRKARFWERFGLSRFKEMTVADNRAYSDGLERMLRPRMILYLENTLSQLMANGDIPGTYRTLKVYLLLGGQGQGDPEDYTNSVVRYFKPVWSSDFSLPGQQDEGERLIQHLEAMLELGAGRQPAIAIDADLIRKARESIVNLPLAEQAYAAIKDRAATSGIDDFNLVERLSGSVEQVFEVTDGAALNTLSVPALYTFEGYWVYFLEQLANARESLRNDEWVLGDAAQRVGYDTQLANLERDLHRMYQLDFGQAWKTMLDRIGMARMSADAPQYDALAAAASPVASPILELIEAVTEETRLVRIYDELEAMDAEELGSAATGGGLADGLGSAVFRRVYQSSGIFQRVVLDNIRSRGPKNEAQVGASGNVVAEDKQRRQVERISDDFEDWHILLKGEEGKRPIDLILSDLNALRENRRQAAMSPTPMDESMLSQFLSALTRNNTALPGPVARMLNEVENEFRTVAENTSMEQLNRALNDEVTQFCRDFVMPFFPFGNPERHISPSVFGQFFGPGGDMDTFYTTHLQPHVTRGPNGLEPNPNSAIGARIAPATLKQFDRAQAIQLAFFASGAQDPDVSMSVSHASSSPSVELSILEVNGVTLRTQPGSTPAGMKWPGEATGVRVELFPQIEGRNSVFEINNGRWDIVEFLRKGRSNVNGHVVDTTHEIGGRSVTYRIEFDSTTVPFLMPELSDFSCPVSLE